ncbi:copper chaperone PCu(A)C [Photobacterium sp. TY1-4]|uniref:copper chaperone PCu(A)C n=1 Tax=Photobacterium sp. TY1-4 TaxID=2899122 RepID=UPI0021BF286D|nr:copper chaperone PCu(A)C [Photobacterium sp. TY1-4]UXI03203.1 copper chaperone PCu(A)C [Photobacterium sp. TY1-4]
MKKIINLLLGSTLLLSAMANAHDYQGGNLHIDHPWSKQVPPTSQVAAAFFEIENRGHEADTLIKAESPIAGKTELHAHIHEDGMMKMREVESIDVPAQGTRMLKPGSYHIMFFELKQVPALGDRFPLTLYFAKAGKVDVEVAVEEATYQPKQQNDSHAMDHSGH